MKQIGRENSEVFMIFIATSKVNVLLHIDNGINEVISIILKELNTKGTIYTELFSKQLFESDSLYCIVYIFFTFTYEYLNLRERMILYRIITSKPKHVSKKERCKSHPKYSMRVPKTLITINKITI